MMMIWRKTFVRRKCGNGPSGSSWSSWPVWRPRMSETWLIWKGKSTQILTSLRTADQGILRESEEVGHEWRVHLPPELTSLFFLIPSQIQWDHANAEYHILHEPCSGLEPFPVGIFRIVSLWNFFIKFLRIKNYSKFYSRNNWAAINFSGWTDQKAVKIGIKELNSTSRIWPTGKVFWNSRGNLRWSWRRIIWSVEWEPLLIFAERNFSDPRKSNQIATLVSMERETTAHGTVNSIYKFRTQERLAEIRRLTKVAEFWKKISTCYFVQFWLNELDKRGVRFEDFMQKVGKETLVKLVGI